MRGVSSRREVLTPSSPAGRLNHHDRFLATCKSNTMAASRGRDTSLFQLSLDSVSPSSMVLGLALSHLTRRIHSRVTLILIGTCRIMHVSLSVSFPHPLIALAFEQTTLLVPQLS